MLATSVLVHVVNLCAFNNKLLSTSVLVYVVALSAMGSKADIPSGPSWENALMFPLCIYFIPCWKTNSLLPSKKHPIGIPRHYNLWIFFSVAYFNASPISGEECSI